ncbi:MAG: hypothetical protein RIS47_1998, partial [Bacteroidota bacterium]
NFSENTCFTKQNGNLIFGGSMGFIEIDPQKFVVTSQLTTVELTTFFLFNKEIAVGENDTPLKQSIPFTTNITLNNNQSSFSIEYVALCQSDQAQVSYAFMLQNFEKDWNYVGNQTKATYTNLSPGKYTFRVKATLRSGRWDQPERILEITILPPWYKTWWAFTIWLVLIAAILWAIRNTLLKLNHYRRDLQVEKRVNQVKLQFFTNISHEIRTPLTLIIGPIEELISDKATAGATKPKLQIIHKNAKRMLLLTNQLLDFRKIQNNKMKIKVRQFDLVRFAKEIYENFGTMAQHKKIDYQFYSQKENLLIWADPSKIDIIIFNLLSNALKFTSAGKKVSLSLVFETKTHVAIQIKDQGKGIPEKLQPELFTRYTILSNNEQSGTGIGLSLSYELAKLHGGDILVNSTEGEGSLFTLKIPIEKEQYLVNSNAVVIEKDIEQVIHSTTGIYTEEDTEQADTPTENKTTQLTALVVEDTPEILEYICNSLQPEFYAIRATNGEEALKMAQTQPIDIIITDLMMPVMDGLELTRKLKSNFDTSHIPIVMLTARTTINDQIEGIGMGAEAYISKPFNTNYLKTVCINLIKQRQKLIDRFTSNKNIEPGQLKIQSKDEDFLQKLVEYIQQHYSDEIVIDHLAEHCCLSRTVFYNKLKGLTGLSPVEFLREMKLKIAIQLLEKGYNVSEVAFKVGFNDVKYFSRQFKAQFGYPPSKHTAPDSHHE